MVEIVVLFEGLGEEERREWVVGEVLKMEEGRKKFEGVDVGKVKKVVVVKGGKLVNFVM